MIRDRIKMGVLMGALASVACGAGDAETDAAQRVARGTGEHLVEIQQATSEADTEALREAIEATGRSGVIVGPESEIVAEVREENARTYFVQRGDSVLVMSVGKLGTRKLLKSLPADLTAAEVFQRLAPEREVPQALLVAAERVKQARIDGSVREPRPALEARELAADVGDEVRVQKQAPSVVGELTQAAVDDSACPGAEFREDNCPSGDITYCRLWRTNTNTILEEDVSHGYASACPYRGNITHRIRANEWSWQTVEETTLAPGDDSWLRVGPEFFDQDIESKVFNSTNDGFHHSAQIMD
jgi:hypothetical protein